MSNEYKNPFEVFLFYQGDYGDDTHYVAMQETDGTKTVLLKGVCRAVAVECCTFGNEYWIKGRYMSGMYDYFDAIIEQMDLILDDRQDN